MQFAALLGAASVLQSAALVAAEKPGSWEVFAFDGPCPPNMKDPNNMPSNNLVTTGHDSKETDINCSPWWYIDDTDDKGKLRDGNTFYIRGFEALGKQIEVYTKTCTKEDFVSKQVKDGCYVVPQGQAMQYFSVRDKE